MFSLLYLLAYQGVGTGVSVARSSAGPGVSPGGISMVGSGVIGMSGSSVGSAMSS
jgi:hypothetical protein